MGVVKYYISSTPFQLSLEKQYIIRLRENKKKMNNVKNKKPRGAFLVYRSKTGIHVVFLAR